MQIAMAVGSAAIQSGIDNAASKPGGTEAKGAPKLDANGNVIPGSGKAFGTVSVMNKAGEIVTSMDAGSPAAMAAQAAGKKLTYSTGNMPRNAKTKQMAAGMSSADADTRAGAMNAMQDLKFEQFAKKNNPANWIEKIMGIGGSGVFGSTDAKRTEGHFAGGPGKGGAFSGVDGYGQAAAKNVSKQKAEARRQKQWDRRYEASSKVKKHAKGGPAHTRGRDTVPAMLTAGEWVVPKETVDLYGLGYMNKLNKGEVQHFAKGGYVGPQGGSDGPSPSVGGASSVNNDFVINVNVTNEGGAGGEASESGERDQNTQGGLEEDERNKELGTRIKGAVVQEIVYQKRPGGLLYNEKRS